MLHRFLASVGNKKMMANEGGVNVDYFAALV